MTKEILLRLQVKAFSSSPWHSVMSAINGVSEAIFFQTPVRHNGFPWMNGSMSDIVYHLTGDKLVQLSTAFDEGQENWKTMESKLNKTEMSKMLHNLDLAQSRVVSTLSELPESRLIEQVTTWGGKRLRIWELFLMLIEHDYYHAGQIRYIRNVLE